MWFIAVEGQAIIEGRYKGKMTFILREIFSMHGKSKWWQIRRAVLVAMLAWLVAHLLFPMGTF